MRDMLQIKISIEFQENMKNRFCHYFINNRENEPNRPNERLFKHLASEKEDAFSPTGTSPTLNTSEHILKMVQDKTDYDENKDKLLIIKPVYQNINQVDLKENVGRQTNDNDNVTKFTAKKSPTNTLKEALKNRDAVAAFIEQRTKANKEDMEKRKQRERDQMYNYYFLNDNTDANTVEKEAQEIYREMLKAVQANSPTPISKIVPVLKRTSRNWPGLQFFTEQDLHLNL